MLESKTFKINKAKTKVMVSESEAELLKSKMDLCGLWEESNSQFNVVHEV